MKKNRFLPVLAALVLVGLGSAVSYAKFDVADPFSAASGIIQVVLTDTEYVQIQDDPVVIVAKPDASLDAYMERYGYLPDGEAQMGSLHTYCDNHSHQTVHCSENQFFARWSWQEG